MFHFGHAHIVIGRTFSASDTLSNGSTDASSGGVNVLLLLFLVVLIAGSVRLAVDAIAPVTEKLRAYKAAISVLIFMLFIAAAVMAT